MKSTWTMREVGVLTSILLASAVITRAVSAQSTDPRWKSMLGCWSTTDSATITLSGKGDAGLPSRTMDLMIALSNPKVFAIDKARPNDLTVRATNAYGSRPGNGTAAWGDVGMSRYSCYSEFDRMLGFGYYPMTFSDPSCYANGQYYRNARYGYNGYGYNAYGYNDGYYWGQTPVIIVNRGTGGTDGTYAPASPQGRAVNGQGYTRDRTSAGASASSSGGYSAPSGSSSSSGSSGSSSGSSGGSSSSGSSGSASGTSTGRTAVPRPPG